ncbi:hypothetical protein DFH07DRAFT_350762 [Mycena maculata]|uniref:Ubiquitin-like domain-containing protein n=1 Tax=Mycena maculata TaxID=230809 RepID=A0AAD7NM54_9AGAR|nr:hypothetical protein DFH07DRAFT_350762 [Mycena maculata]
MADQAETAFLRSFLATLNAQTVTYGDDYQQPPENSLKRVPVLQIPVPAPPAKKRAVSSDSNSEITLTFRSLKPPLSFTLTLAPTDTIATAKQRLHGAGGPAVEAVRLVLKGKVMADGRLLREYGVKEGDVVSVVVKAGGGVAVAASDATKATTEAAAPASESTATTDAKPPALTLSTPAPAQQGPTRKHTRIPSVVLSPSPSTETPLGGLGGDNSRDITLTLDDEPAPPSEALSSYHAAVAKPEFWVGLLGYLRSALPPADAHLAFEDFLRAAKGALTASDIARIRDVVGVVGMAGT